MEFIQRSATKRAQMEFGINGTKWYCRTCNIHCENHKIFLNHLTTENHRQRKHSSQNFQTSERQKLSEKFVDGFIDILSKFKRKRVPASMVLKTYNLQSNSISLEDTQWKTLQEFLHWLKCDNKCNVNETFELLQEFDNGNPKRIDIFERQRKVTKVRRDSLCPYVRKMLKLDENRPIKRSSAISEKEKLSRDFNDLEIYRKLVGWRINKVLKTVLKTYLSVCLRIENQRKHQFRKEAGIHEKEKKCSRRHQRGVRVR